MFHTYTVFITQGIVPRPLPYDKYLALSCKSHTLSQIIINVLHYDIFFKYPYSLIRLQPIYNSLLLHAILSTVLDIIGLYYSLLYYFWD